MQPSVSFRIVKLYVVHCSKIFKFLFYPSDFPFQTSFLHDLYFARLRHIVFHKHPRVSFPFLLYTVYFLPREKNRVIGPNEIRFLGLIIPEKQTQKFSLSGAHMFWVFGPKTPRWKAGCTKEVKCEFHTSAPGTKRPHWTARGHFILPFLKLLQ